MRAFAFSSFGKARSRASNRVAPRAKPASGVYPIQRKCSCGGGCPSCQEDSPIQAKLAVSQPGDPYEQEAEEAAQRVTGERTADAGCPCGGGCPACSGREAIAAPLFDRVLGAPGQPLDDSTRFDMEERLGHDFRDVRVHLDDDAARSARMISAEAFTSGRNIVFGEGRYRPESKEGRGLLAHELTHVVQQGASSVPGIQRKPAKPAVSDKPAAPDKPPQPKVPADLLTSPDLSKMKQADLVQRYDDLNKWYAVKGLTNDENTKLKKGIGDVGGELAKRALAAGRTFSVDDVQKMKRFFMDTVSKRKKVTDKEGEDAAEKEFQCINVLRKGMTQLYGDDKGLTMTTHNTMEETMQQLGDAGRAGPAHVIKFVSKSGKTIGKGSGLRPEKPETSIWDYLMTEVKGDIGFSVFGLSLMDGWHSVTLTVDNRNPKNPIVRFTDHTLHHDDGWEAMRRDDTRAISDTEGYPFEKGSKRSLDQYITYFVQVNWDSQDEDKKATSWIRLWRLHRPPSKPKATSATE